MPPYFLQVIKTMKKVLILSANPKNTSPLRLGEEAREIQAALKRANNREQFEIFTEWAIRVEDLRRALLEHQPTIVHFSGHGSGTEGLALENNSGQVQLVSTESLARLFGLFQGKIECVLLNACYSQAQAEAIHQHIDYVVGMNQAIGDVAAIEFAIGFYDALFAGRSYEDCFEVGRASIDLQGIPEFSTPQLKARRRVPSFSVQDNIQKREKPESKTKPRQNMTPEKPSQSIVFNGGSNSGQIGQAGRDLNQNHYNTQGVLEKQLTISEQTAQAGHDVNQTQNNYIIRFIKLTLLSEQALRGSIVGVVIGLSLKFISHTILYPIFQDYTVSAKRAEFICAIFVGLYCRIFCGKHLSRKSQKNFLAALAFVVTLSVIPGIRQLFSTLR